MSDQIAKAVETITKAIKDDDSLFYAYQANIAMAFKDEYARNIKRYKNRQDIHEIANKATINFLNLWGRKYED